MRKTADVTIGPEGGRDAGRLYRITEMSAEQAELWAAKVFLALNRSGTDIPDDVMGRGIAGLAAMSMSVLSGIRIEELKPILEEMMGCVAFIPNPQNPMTQRCPPWADDIEEVRTRLKLRSEVFELHTGFSVASFLQERMDRMKEATTEEDGLTTQTSLPSLETSS